jgi:hypothetical protein
MVLTELPNDPEVKNIVEQFLLWEEKANPKWLASEIQVGSLTHRYCGILDAVAIINGERVLIDFKTSSGIKDDYRIQLAGLWLALEEMGCPPNKRAILHLPKEGEYEFRYIEGHLEEEKKDFLAGVAFYNRKNLFMGRNKSDKKDRRVLKKMLSKSKKEFREVIGKDEEEIGVKFI